jgi:hypothetical protein
MLCRPQAPLSLAASMDPAVAAAFGAPLSSGKDRGRHVAQWQKS